MAENVEIKSERQNPLFGRREITAEMRAEGATPERKKVLKLLAEKLGAAEDCIVLEKIEHRYGTRSAKILASVYETAELANKEPAWKFARGSGKKKAGGEAKPEKKAEAKKEEGKKEEKK